MAEPSFDNLPDGPGVEELKVPSFDYAKSFAGSKTPIVIDNGSYQMRAGWASENDPRYVFHNVVTKFRNKKISNSGIVLVGNDAYTDSTARSNIKSAFDSGILNNYDVLENSFDYVFSMLGCEGSSIEHPIVLTELLCAPYSTRKSTSELLFEGYSVPSISYTVDSLCSYYNYETSQSRGPSNKSTGLMVSSGNNSTQIIPIYDSRPLLNYAKRINIGGNDLSDYMHKLLQAKYPSFPVKLTNWHTQYMVHNYTYFSSDYCTELAGYLDKSNLNAHDKMIQFPFPVPTREEKTEEELAQIAERRREQALKLQELAAKSRVEKLVAREQELEELQALKEAKDTYSPSEFLSELREYGLKTIADLDDAISKSVAIIERARKKSLGETLDEKPSLPPECPLVDIPDAELDEAGIKEKRKQKLLKANYEARERARQLKEIEQQKKEEEAKKDEEFRLNRFDQWLDELKNRRLSVLSKINERKQKYKELNERRSQAAQARMKNIADLASNETPPNGSSASSTGAKRRRRNNGSADKEDTFGADDEDWSIYRDISKEEDEEEEEEDKLNLNQCNELLERYAPDYLAGLDREAKNRIQNTLMYRFSEGTQEAILDETAAQPSKDEAWQLEIDTAARQYQMHLNIERIRVPEVLFQPSIIGIDQSGIVETISQILKNIKDHPASEFVKNIYLTGGGFAMIPGLSQRLESELRMVMPIGTDIRIHFAENPLLDAWRGAAKWARSPTFSDSCVTRQMYLECGGDYLKEHALSNRYYKATELQPKVNPS
ncbi:Nuclear actin-protein involved in chromatin remodeling [Mycoemilia scoparia]|uniref:Nuclear actin-protein involved in chromatin remodeling n=1 Tax=Mycoemilia scoparia TaxID=417184 RepID=A0A9W8DMV7_9FUNG|nr:Nuclear actin-protein involved in chromatin remodeling [Mycoemilia scoparia]